MVTLDTPSCREQAGLIDMGGNKGGVVLLFNEARNV